MWDFQSLLGAGGVTLEGGQGPQRRRPPLSDGDWSRLRRGLGLVRRGTRAFQHLGSTPGKTVTSEEPVGLADFSPAACPPGRAGSGEGAGGAPPHHGGEGGACRVSGAGPVGGGGRRGGSSGGLEGCRGPGRRQQD